MTMASDFERSEQARLSASTKLDRQFAPHWILDEARKEVESERLPVTSDPEPLRRPLPPAEAYPLDALGSVLGGAANRLHAVVGAPMAMCGQSILAAASLAAQHIAIVSDDGRHEPISLWCVTVADSGERKSAVDRWALKEHREVERSNLDQYRHAMIQHGIELQAYEVAGRNVAKGKDIEAIEHGLKQLGTPPEPPLKPLLLVSTPTIEGIHKQLSVGLPSLGLFHDDAGEFFGGHSMNKENRTKTASGFSRLWDCGEFDRVRAGDGAEKHFGKTLAMHLMIQPVIAETILSDDVLVGQGFLARCLMSWPASTIGTRPYVQADLSTDPAMRRYWQTMRSLLEIQPNLRTGTRNELEPRSLTLAPNAKQRWVAVYTAIEGDMANRGAYASIRAWAGKAPSQILRVAAVITLTEQHAAQVILVDAIDRAATLINHYLTEAVRIVGTHSVAKSVRDAESLLAWCHDEGITQLYSGAALRLGPNAIRTQHSFNAAVVELERCGWVTPIDGGAFIDGAHRRRAWVVQLKVIP